MTQRDLTCSELRDIRTAAGGRWFTKPFDLNLVIVRSQVLGRWDDTAFWAFTDDAGRELVEAHTVTGDAWEGEWLNPSHRDGCLFILDQHVNAAFAVGKTKVGTKNERTCLRQRSPFDYARWVANGSIPTPAQLEALARSGAKFTAVRYSHLHNRVSGRTPEKPATDDSEGCVVYLYQHQFVAMLELVAQQKARGHGDTVSATFITR